MQSAPAAGVLAGAEQAQRRDPGERTHFMKNGRSAVEKNRSITSSEAAVSSSKIPCPKV
jgi:hypothetical protein